MINLKSAALLSRSYHSGSGKDSRESKANPLWGAPRIQGELFKARY